MYFLEEAAARGAMVLRGRVTGVGLRGGKVTGVEVATPGGSETIATERFVVAAGPFAARVAALLGVELPIHCELHRKMALEDRHRVVPRDAPLVIWDDPQFLPWSEAERRSLDTAPEMHHLLRRFPAGAHFRPEGGPDSQTLLLLWAYDIEPVEPRLPLPDSPDFPEIVLRGLCTPVPGLATYLEPLQRGFVDGGYYTKTRENRPLIGPLPVEGAFVFAALSGYGLMAASAGGELLAAHLAGTQLPPWADAFRLERYADPKYRALLENWGDTGQL
jgi:glycine/D-amino acid oxidase-like deaminating enzyme